MIDYLTALKDWKSKNLPAAIATVTSTWGSAPRPVGSVMLVNKNSDILGSVSGGCVEGAVVKEAQRVIESKEAKRLAFGVSDEEAWSVGLSCGGSIQVFLQPFSFDSVIIENLVTKLESNAPCIWIYSLEDGKNKNTLLSFDGDEVSTSGNDINPKLSTHAVQAYDERSHRTTELDGITYFVHVFPPKAQLIVVGAAHITVDLVQLGHLYDFETIVIDPRGAFTDKTMFKINPDKIFKSYPSEVLSNMRLDAYTYCAILSHDPKIDDNALEVLLPSKVAYIGALGSKKTHAKRTNRLREKGVSDELIARINAPIGLPIKAKSAKEIAFSVMGEILQVKNQFL
ncbi:MAG: XdhC family protein [Bacteroidota bacterium]